MGAVVALETLLAARTVWHAGRSAAIGADGEATGHPQLDELLPQGGWPRRALTELLLPADGVGELSLLLPTLARMTRAGGTVALVAPPYIPYAPAWQAAGVDLAHLEIVEADPRNALWAFEQCLRSGACAAVLGWPQGADAQSLRRLQVAADSGDCLGFALRDRKHAANPSPAALRLEYVAQPQLQSPQPQSPEKEAYGPQRAHGRVAPHRISESHAPVSQWSRPHAVPLREVVPLREAVPLQIHMPLQMHQATQVPATTPASPGAWHVRKCRGGQLPSRPLVLATH